MTTFEVIRPSSPPISTIEAISTEALPSALFSVPPAVPVLTANSTRPLESVTVEVSFITVTGCSGAGFSPEVFSTKSALEPAATSAAKSSRTHLQEPSGHFARHLAWRGAALPELSARARPDASLSVPLANGTPAETPAPRAFSLPGFSTVTATL